MYTIPAKVSTHDANNIDDSESDNRLVRNLMSHFAHLRAHRRQQQRTIEALCKRLGYSFNNIDLLKRALTRRSALEEGVTPKRNGDFQRLEYLGDSALGLAISGLLFRKCPSYSPGQLTEAAKKFVSNTVLSNIAKQWILGDHLIVGNGEALNNIGANNKALADAVEAIIGAIYLDSNKDLSVLTRLVIKHWRLSSFTGENLTETVSGALFDDLSMALPEWGEDDLDNMLGDMMPGYSNRTQPFSLARMFAEEEEKARLKEQKIETGWYLIHEGEPTKIAKILEEFIRAQECRCEGFDDMDEFLDAIFAGNLATIKHLCKEEYIDARQLTAADLNPSIEELQGESLHLAAELNKPEFIPLFLTYHFDINALDSNDATPLHRAAEFNSPACVQTLIEHGADRNRQDIYGNTALHKAAMNAHSEAEEIITLLLNAGCATGLLNRQGRTPLHLAAEETESWGTQILEMLLSEGGINVKDHEGQTPLFRPILWPGFINFAAGNRFLKILDAGANPNVEDNAGLTVLEYAQRDKDMEVIVELLKRRQEATDVQTPDKRSSADAPIKITQHKQQLFFKQKEPATDIPEKGENGITQTRRL